MDEERGAWATQLETVLGLGGLTLTPKPPLHIPRAVFSQVETLKAKLSTSNTAMDEERGAWATQLETALHLAREQAAAEAVKGEQLAGTFREAAAREAGIATGRLQVG